MYIYCIWITNFFFSGLGHLTNQRCPSSSVYGTLTERAQWEFMWPQCCCCCCCWPRTLCDLYCGWRTGFALLALSTADAPPACSGFNPRMWSCVANTTTLFFLVYLPQQHLVLSSSSFTSIPLPRLSSCDPTGNWIRAFCTYYNPQHILVYLKQQAIDQAINLCSRCWFFLFF